MKFHHFNAGTMCLDAAMFADSATIASVGPFVCNVLLLETTDGLTLVDTGLGTGDIADPKRLGAQFLDFANPSLDPQETAIAHVRRLGFDPKDVRHILMTHLDRDHGGGIADFPHAKIHVHLDEHDIAARQSQRGNGRYISQQWGRTPHWKFYGDAGEDWFGFKGVRAFGDHDPDVLIIPLPGHSAGHCGVAVRTSETWLLHAGDCFYLRREIETPPCELPDALKVFQAAADFDRAQRMANRDRLRHINAFHCDEVTIINSHEGCNLACCAAISYAT